LRAGRQRAAAIGSPARLITASNPVSAESSASDPTSAVPAGSTARARAALRLNTLSSCPFSASTAHSALPMKPVPPVSRIRIADFPRVESLI
jgi:hypothetical protein